MSEKKCRFYTAGDYAGMESGKYEFYYGYEDPLCPVHGKDSRACGDDDCCESEWCFVAKENGKEVARYVASELEKIGKCNDMADYLLAGIAKFLSEVSNDQI